MPSAGRPKGNGCGSQVQYGIFNSDVGATLIAAGPAGVCAIAFADTDEQLHAHLRGSLPHSEFQRNDMAVEPHARLLCESLSHGTAFNVLLDVRGTAFQQRVWAALQAIPRGSTQTYTGLARALGLPATAARAVATACAANPVALAIPCHRVVGTGGELRGYRWGIQRKRQLLQLEQSWS